MLNSLVGIFFMIINAVVTYRGIKKCFEIHQKTDSKNFFERFCILSVPIEMKLIVVLFPLTIVLTLFVFTLKDAYPDFYKRFPIIYTASSPFITWIYFNLLTRSIKRLGEMPHTTRGNSC